VVEHPGYIVGRRARRRRRDLNMTQEELSKRSGLRQSTIARIESGTTRNLETRTLIALAEGLGVSLDALVGRAPMPPAPENQPEPTSLDQVGAHA
jgi:transcriptional regulator with XRE-family HTH domain